ncbi:hypothetical protein GW750_01515 [bacterium]|nr:hypothetical protein [bacterium]
MIPPYRLFPHAINNTENLMSQLQTQLNWKQYPIKIFGKEMMQPRLVSFAADKDISYTYSQTTLI